MGNLRFTSRITEWRAGTEKDLDISVLEMATDIHREASIKAPKDSRALVNSGRIARESPAHYKVIFGGDAVPYARRRHYENKRNPGTLYYLETPGERISRNILRYIK